MLHVQKKYAKCTFHLVELTCTVCNHTIFHSYFRDALFLDSWSDFLQPQLEKYADIPILKSNIDHVKSKLLHSIDGDLCVKQPVIYVTL